MTPALRNIATLNQRADVVISSELRVDVIYCTLLMALTAIMVVPGSLTLPMELWDESRNANNAMEMARHGGWMVPTFAGLPDHWNTKPPLLIWIVAGLLRTGMDPMLAIRLPSVAATMGSVLLVYLTCRTVLQDRLAGLLAGLLLLCSVLFIGDHVGRTGDYDALLSLPCLGFVLCIGQYIEAPPDRSGKWIAGGAVLFVLALMTKGVAAGLAVPGLLAYAIARRRLLAILRDWRLYVAVFCVFGAIASLLVLRERLDPGYLAALWSNDVTGRMLTALDQHTEGPLFYLVVLAVSVQPTVLLLPMLLTMRRETDAARRHLCSLMMFTACGWLIALSCAETKIYWYIAPAVPMLAIAAATATTTFLHKREQSAWTILRPVIVTLVIVFWYLNIRAPGVETEYAADQVWYGPFLAEIRGDIPLDGGVLVDQGLPNDAGFAHYNPVARFFAEDAGRHGVRIQVATPDMTIAADTTIISCDPRVKAWLKNQSLFVARRTDAHCVMGRASFPFDKSAE